MTVWSKQRYLRHRTSVYISREKSNENVSTFYTIFYQKTVHFEVNPSFHWDVGRTQEKLRDQEPEANDLQKVLGNFEDNFLNDDVHLIKPLTIKQLLMETDMKVNLIE